MKNYRLLCPSSVIIVIKNYWLYNMINVFRQIDLYVYLFGSYFQSYFHMRIIDLYYQIKFFFVHPFEML